MKFEGDKQDMLDIIQAKEILVKEAKHWIVWITTGFLPENEGTKIAVDASVDNSARIVMIKAYVQGNKVGRAIGRNGVIATAIRQIFKNVGRMYDVTVSIDVLPFEAREVGTKHVTEHEHGNVQKTDGVDPK